MPVREWIALGNYKDIAERSSPSRIRARDYVQAILQNREMYRPVIPLTLPSSGAAWGYS